MRAILTRVLLTGDAAPRHIIERMMDRFRKQKDEPYPELSPVTLRPIGYVRNKVKQPMTDGWEKIESRIIIDPRYEAMLLNLGEYSHVWVLFWPHEVPEEIRGSEPQMHPRHDEQYPLMGVLATRSQTRPNPVLMTPAKLVELKANVLRVRGLDAIDGTPVLDLKPYLPHFDAIADATTPPWVRKMRR